MTIRYLKPNIVLEPLVCKWYAWLHLVSPMTAGAHFKKRYIKLIESFLEHKELHQEASKNPELAGGFFVNLDDAQFEKAKSLLSQMRFDLDELILLSDAIDDINLSLSKLSSDGESLEPHYLSKVPQRLRGAVELFYDLNNFASVRFIEPILYRRHYASSLQSILISSYKSLNQRPFVTSTPRLKGEGNVELHLPFSSELIDRLVASRETGVDYEELVNSLGLCEADHVTFNSFFNDEKPSLPGDRNFDGEGVRVRYFGHACILIQTKKASVLIDPLIRNYEFGDDSYSYFDLPETIDAVLITHAHQDHLVLETLLQLRPKIKSIYVPRNNGGSFQDPSMKLMLQEVGFRSVCSLEEFDLLHVEDIVVRALPFLGEHGDLSILSKLAYHITAKKQTFLFAVDSNNLDPELYHSIKEVTGVVDNVFIGMECKGAPYSWTYGPLSARPIQYQQDQARRLSGSDSNKAWKIVESLGAKNCYVYAMGLEPWLAYLLGIADDSQSLPIQESNRFIAMCRDNGIQASRLYLKNEFFYGKGLVSV